MSLFLHCAVCLSAFEYLLNNGFSETFVFGSFTSGLVTQTRDPFRIWDLMESRERSLLKWRLAKQNE
jgi:hypothetical protein